MRKGDCFRGDLRFRGNPHYWLVLSDPDAAGKIALVNCTTGSAGPKAQVIKKIDCPALEYDSELAWSESVIVANGGIDLALGEAQFEPKAGMDPRMVDNLLAEGILKELVPREVVKFLGLRY